jgi:hypothetical protein
LGGGPWGPPQQRERLNMEKLKDLVKSRKFWASALGLALVVAKVYKPDLAISEEQIATIVGVLVAFIVGTGLENIGAGSGSAGPSA